MHPTPRMHRLSGLIGLCLGLLACSGPQSGLRPDAAPGALSAPARTLLLLITQQQDNQGQPFVIIDKQQARLWAFDGAQRLIAHTPVLLGSAVGDDSVPGIGTRPLSRIAPHERTTPAGRFAVQPGRNAKGEDIFWIDYEAAVSMHRLRSLSPRERRAERMDSATPSDNRISYGCVNVPAAFYERHLHQRFARGGLAYVLPEQHALAQVFPGLRQKPGRTSHRAWPG